MKKKALWKDIFREIAKSKARFLSIFLIILLGVAFYSGIKATSPDMVDTADTYYKENDLMDVKVQSTYGLTEDDINLLKEVKGATVEATYTQDVILEKTDLVTKIVSTPNEQQTDLNKPLVIEGKLPEKSGEIALDAKSAYGEEYSIGDTITFTTDDDSVKLEESFSGLTYEVVGFVNSPQFIENNSRGNTSIGSGTLDGFAFISEEDFNLDVFTEAYMAFQDTEDLQSYSGEYEAQIEDNQNVVEDVLINRPEERRDEIKKTIQEEIDKGQVEIDEGLAEIEEGKQALADAEAELANARNELDQGWQEYNNGVQTFETEIANGQATIDQETQNLENARIEIVNGKATLDVAQEELDNSRAMLEQERASAETQIANGVVVLQNARETVTLPNALVTTEVQNSLKVGAEEISPEMASLVTGYFEGSVPAQVVLPAIDEVEANLQNSESSEATEATQAWIETARSAIQIPGMNVSLDRQVQVIEQLSAIEVQLGDLMTNYYDGVVPPNDVLETLDSTESRIIGIRQQLDAYQAELDAGQEQINQQRAELEAAEDQIANGKVALEQAQEQLIQETANGEAELQQAQADLEQGEADYEAGMEEFQAEKEDAEVEIENAEAEIAKGQRELDDARSELDDITLPEYYVLNRNTNPGYAEFNDNAERIASIAQIFPVFFFLIAALVSLTTMTRMVDEQRTQIGTLKALGYTNWDISKKFLVYASLASIAGAVIGLIVGFHLFPTIIINAYGSLYNLSDVQIGYYPKDIIFSLIIAFLCTGLTALIAVRVSLQSNAAELMRPKAPKIGKRILLERIPFLWNRFTFTQKITARNIFRYKQRMFMTIAGIAGCTALLLTGFGLSDSISDVGVLQYGKINQYESIIALNTEADDFEKEEYNQLIEETSELESGLKVYQEIYNTEAEDVNPQDVTVFVPESTENVDEFVTLTDRTSEENYELTNNGAIVSEKLAELFDLQVGDTLTLEDTDNQKIEVTISQITENYLQHYVYLSPEYYESVVGELPEPNTHLLNFNESQNWEDEFGQQMTQLDAVVGVTFTSLISESFKDTLDSLVIVTIVLVVSAALLAFVVLYNLTNINVSERIRELSTIKVLGFYDKEVTMYVYRENILLTLMGIVVGLLLGLLLHGFVLDTAELDAMMFSPVIATSSYIYSALLTLLFSTIVMLFMHIKLKNVDMLEALKTVE